MRKRWEIPLKGSNRRADEIKHCKCRMVDVIRKCMKVSFFSFLSLYKSTRGLSPEYSSESTLIHKIMYIICRALNNNIEVPFFLHTTLSYIIIKHIIISYIFCVSFNKLQFTRWIQLLYLVLPKLLCYTTPIYPFYLSFPQSHSDDTFVPSRKKKDEHQVNVSFFICFHVT